MLECAVAPAVTCFRVCTAEGALLVLGPVSVTVSHTAQRPDVMPCVSERTPKSRPFSVTDLRIPTVSLSSTRPRLPREAPRTGVMSLDPTLCFLRRCPRQENPHTQARGGTLPPREGVGWASFTSHLFAWAELILQEKNKIGSHIPFFCLLGLGKAFPFLTQNHSLDYFQSQPFGPGWGP